MIRIDATGGSPNVAAPRLAEQIGGGAERHEVAVVLDPDVERVVGVVPDLAGPCRAFAFGCGGA